MVGQQWKLISLFFIILNISSGHLLSQSDSTRRPTVGLVLSGGGAKGLAHIGVIKVLEEVGIPVDYVGGTSMGSIVGGLYAAGYSAREIESIVLKQNWIELLTDQFQRRSLSVTEKEDYDKYLISFPFQNLRFRMPSGLGAGQNISMLLADLLLPVSDIEDFSSFKRPFLCVATDIVNGEEVVLKDGYLPDAIRASMAIPTIFTPIEIDGKLLVDGGLVNNFPVDRVKEFNPDIIIGVNLGLKEYSKEELKNLATVLEQSIFFQAKERNQKNQALCDILIKPDVYSSSAASFSNASALIKIGEKAANDMRQDLIKMADSISSHEHDPLSMPKIDSLNVETVTIQGLENVTERFLYGKLRLRLPGLIAVKDLHEGIERAYGTQFFQKITYRIENLENSNVHLIIRIEEKADDLIRLGARYDSEFKTQVLLNTTFRNKIIKGSKLSLDLYLGLYPRFSAEYRIHTGWKPRKFSLMKNNRLGILPDLGLRLDTRNLQLSYYENGDLLANYYYQYFVIDAFGSSLISNAFYIEAGGSYEFSGLKGVIPSEQEPIDNEALLLYGLFKIDSYNKRAFPTKGGYFYGLVQLVNDFNTESSFVVPLTKVIVKTEKVFSVNKHIHVLPRIESGMTVGDTVSPLHRVFLGGNLHYSTSPLGTFSFVGFRFMEKMDYSLLTAGIKFRVTILEHHHLIFDNNFGKSGRYFTDILREPYALYYGYGFQYGYNSILGPFEIGVYKSNFNKIGWQFYMNFGLRF